jgi:1-deoxy-D-xylulose-5-phosphate reductoisomerase
VATGYPAVTTRKVTILGSTGSVGCSTLDVIAQANQQAEREKRAPEFEIVGLTAHSRAPELIAQALAVRPKVVAITDEVAAQHVRHGLAGSGITVLSGPNCANDVAAEKADLTVAAIVGAAGLRPTLTAVEQGAVIALANKECLVCAGPVFLDAVKRHNSRILPLDSEHNAIFQVLDGSDQVDRLILTASGGPFRTASRETIDNATPAQAIAHPNWSMGPKISVDSATLMNKGLELIEAALLFDMPESRIDVLVHPQSVIHSMVSYKDGSVLAQLGAPDMRIPIAHALAWPRRFSLDVPRLDLAAIGQLEFSHPDLQRFPLLALARTVLNAGPGAATVMNAANEIALESFLIGKIKFPQIAAIVAESVQVAARQGIDARMGCLDDVAMIDSESRIIAANLVERCSCA